MTDENNEIPGEELLAAFRTMLKNLLPSTLIEIEHGLAPDGYPDGSAGARLLGIVKAERRELAL